MPYEDLSIEELNAAVISSFQAFLQYRNVSLAKRSELMYAIASELGKIEPALIETAAKETSLQESRLKNELARTILQLRTYADACSSGDWMDIRIDTSSSQKGKKRPDLRKMMLPLGPVAVFGAANFPFAYSTAGGDTACALAAGCTVVVKAHPMHAETSEMVAEAIKSAVSNCSLHAATFTHIHGASHEVGKALVEHPLIRAVGFTGSQSGGRQLFDWAAKRKEPIPVFAEMSSINPVFLMPDRMKKYASDTAKLFASSITLGVGQFCTNPGLIIAIDNDDLRTFIDELSAQIRETIPGDMLNAGIFKNYVEKRANALAQDQVEMVAVSSAEPIFNQGSPTLATATAMAFIHNPILHQEVFGPYSLIVKCKDTEEMLQVSEHIEGQLTCTVIATASDIKNNEKLIENLKFICGRFVLNGVPTGVEVVAAMQHGGPYPATTDSRFSSVGPDGIKRFARPVAYQNWTNNLLPDELKNENPLGIWRTINNKLTREAVPAS